MQHLGDKATLMVATARRIVILGVGVILRSAARVWGIGVSGSRIIGGLVMGALCVAGIAAVPALGASDAALRGAKRAAIARTIGAFTPAAADPRLAAVFAKAGLDTSDLRFTPSEIRRDGNRAVTVAVRARSSRAGFDAARAASASVPAVSLTPIAYSLGASVGWKRFALSGDMAKVDLAGLPGGRESVDVGLSYTGRKFSGRVKAQSDRPLPGAPKLVEEAPAYALDVGGSYSLSRNLDVTAGVRYKATERDRLQRLQDDRRDSQAVYIGTAFRF